MIVSFFVAALWQHGAQQRMCPFDTSQKVCKVTVMYASTGSVVADLICSATCGGRMEGSCKLGAVTTALVEG